MSETGTEFLTEIARRVADSDAKADAELADILAGRPYKKRAAPKAAEASDTPAPVKKPRAKRTPAAKKPRASSTT